MTIRNGGCLCGKVRYSLLAAPQSVVMCHCHHCQKAGGGSFSVNLLVKEEDYQQQQGKLKCFTDTGDSGLPSYRYFCGDCGSPVFTKATNLPGIYLVKAGTLDDSNGLTPQAEIYTRHASEWHVPLSNTACFTDSPAS